MARDWFSLVHYALAGAGDDPYVRLLKERLRSGSQIVRIHLENTGQGPEYVVILSLHKQLSEMRLPHSEAFTSWSLEAGARLANEVDEAERFMLLVGERFAPMIRELGASSFASIIVPYVPVSRAAASAVTVPHRLRPRTRLLRLPRLGYAPSSTWWAARAESAGAAPNACWRRRNRRRIVTLPPLPWPTATGDHPTGQVDAP